jgi:hypothetical protein
MTNYYIPDPSKFFIPGRAQLVADTINARGYSEVHDFGCGNMKLKYLLKKKKYIGYDCHVGTKPHVVVDLNVTYPLLSPDSRNKRIACCQGILEAIVDVPAFFRFLNSNFDSVVFSYINMRFSRGKKIKPFIPKEGFLPKIYSYEELEGVVKQNFEAAQLDLAGQLFFSSHPIFQVYYLRRS